MANENLDSDLLRDLDAHISNMEQNNLSGQGSIETAAAKMQALKIVYNVVGSLEADRRNLIEHRQRQIIVAEEKVHRIQNQISDIGDELHRLECIKPTEVVKKLTDDKKRTHNHVSHYYSWLDAKGAVSKTSESTSGCSVDCTTSDAEDFIKTYKSSVKSGIHACSAKLDEINNEIAWIEWRRKIVQDIEDEGRRTKNQNVVRIATPLDTSKIENLVCYGSCRLNAYCSEHSWYVFDNKLYCESNCDVGSALAHAREAVFGGNTSSTLLLLNHQRDVIQRKLQHHQKNMELLKSARKIPKQGTTTDDYAKHAYEYYFYEWQDADNKMIQTPTSIAGCKHSDVSCIHQRAEDDLQAARDQRSVDIDSLRIKLAAAQRDLENLEGEPILLLEEIDQQISLYRKQINEILGFG